MTQSTMDACAASLANDRRDPAAGSAFTGLYCLHCRYDLSGQMEERCPECGRVFDPDYLRRLASPLPQPVPPLG